MNFNTQAGQYQTKAFRLLGLGLVVVGLGILHRRRMKQIASRTVARADERVRLAGELHDTLLQTLQGSKMVVDDALEDDGVDNAVQRPLLKKLSAWLGQAIQEGQDVLHALSAITTRRE